MKLWPNVSVVYLLISLLNILNARTKSITKQYRTYLMVHLKQQKQTKSNLIIISSHAFHFKKECCYKTRLNWCSVCVMNCIYHIKLQYFHKVATYMWLLWEKKVNDNCATIQVVFVFSKKVKLEWKLVQNNGMGK